ncbi:hypothetical protein EYC84_001055 [Monilinia fructicola]|uniref:Uncharacterized protein n=1 Tax=Monilinia fructicola TaxID=38448 RepID=A0A5M9JL20_MONFR|nr:hypothetical protein EYC84_001055 [Monilinia fructicola]
MKGMRGLSGMDGRYCFPRYSEFGAESTKSFLVEKMISRYRETFCAPISLNKLFSINKISHVSPVTKTRFPLF